MCTSPLVRYRAKKMDAGTFLASSTNWIIKSAKELQSYFKSYSHYMEYMDEYMDYQYIPCRKCDECRAKYSQDWSVRCYHEFQMNETGCFLTLTIGTPQWREFVNDEKKFKKWCKRYCAGCVNGNRYFKYPPDYSLNKGLLLDQLKRMRDRIYKDSKGKVSIRYFGCGEYGSEDERPHYHVIIFGYNFPDKKPFTLSRSGYQMYISKYLNEMWPFGISTVQDLDYELCSYTAKYVTKQIKYMNDQDEFENYYGRSLEFLVMSRGSCNVKRCKYIDEIIKNCKGMKSLRSLDNPYCQNCDRIRGGIGFSWLQKYYKDVFKRGYISVKDKKLRIPKYYCDVVKLTDEKIYDKYKLSKQLLQDERYEEHPEEMSTERLEVRKEVIRGRLNRCIRA